MLLLAATLIGLGLPLGHPPQAKREIQPALSYQPSSSGGGRPSIPWRDARTFAEVLEHVRREYVEVRSDQELMEAAIRGMMADLDPYSAYLDPEQLEELRIGTSGEYSGVGIEVMLENNRVTVVAPIEDTPAARAGLKAGDTILAVDGVSVKTDDLNDAIDRMRGRIGTQVKIMVARQPLDEPLEFTLARASVHVRSVSSELPEPDLGYVKISHFSETTAPDLEQVLAKLKKRNGRALRGLVLDLRDNPGGVLEAAVSVSDLFLESGLIVSADGRTADARFEALAGPGDMLEGAPVVVLVNGGSASASEIVAAALKDHGRARLVGSRTYGKGSVQTVMPLSDGRAIKLTTSRYYTPSGASIHERGIMPDVLVGTGIEGAESVEGTESAEDAKVAGVDESVTAGTDEIAIRNAAGRSILEQGDRELQVALSMLRESRGRQSRAF
ncbi:S41 family peptidase [Steroidobacter denitrificans]|uniref:S41 family peptidase n=1 Tax=Steroidobacter denitrificans TaxID=465721 RepID=UPI00143C313E|nr:S41 family peptidase [Steroidobacter denitrificans]